MWVFFKKFLISFRHSGADLFSHFLVKGSRDEVHSAGTKRTGPSKSWLNRPGSVWWRFDSSRQARVPRGGPPFTSLNVLLN